MTMVLCVEQCVSRKYPFSFLIDTWTGYVFSYLPDLELFDIWICGNHAQFTQHSANKPSLWLTRQEFLRP